MNNYNNFGEYFEKFYELKGDNSPEDNAIIAEGIFYLKKSIVPFCVKNTRTPEEAEDLQQDIMFQFFKAMPYYLDKLKDMDAQSRQRYLMGIACHVKADYWKDSSDYYSHLCSIICMEGDNQNSEETLGKYHHTDDNLTEWAAFAKSALLEGFVQLFRLERYSLDRKFVYLYKKMFCIRNHNGNTGGLDDAIGYLNGHTVSSIRDSLRSDIRSIVSIDIASKDMNPVLNIIEFEMQKHGNNIIWENEKRAKVYCSRIQDKMEAINQKEKLTYIF